MKFREYKTHFTTLPDFISEFAVLVHVTMLKMLPTNLAHTFQTLYMVHHSNTETWVFYVTVRHQQGKQSLNATGNSKP
jgi:hypothetical protein